MKKCKGKKTADDEENRGGRGSDEDDSEMEEPRWKVREARFKQKVSLVALRAATLIYASSHRPKKPFRRRKFLKRPSQMQKWGKYLICNRNSWL